MTFNILQSGMGFQDILFCCLIALFETLSSHINRMYCKGIMILKFKECSIEMTLLIYDYQVMKIYGDI